MFGPGCIRINPRNKPNKLTLKPERFETVNTMKSRLNVLMSMLTRVLPSVPTRVLPSVPSVPSVLLVVVLVMQLPVVAQPIQILKEESSLWIEGRSNLHPFACVAAEFGALAVADEVDAGVLGGADERGDQRDSRSGEGIDDWRDDGAESSDMNARDVKDRDVEVIIRTDSFDCGKRRMNHDLREALKADEHEVIGFEYRRMVAFEWVEGSGVGDAGAEDAGAAANVQNVAGANLHSSAEANLQNVAEANLQSNTPETIQKRSFVMRVEGDLTVAGVTRRVEVSLEGVRLDHRLVHAQGKTELVMSDYEIDPPKALLGLIEVRDQLTVHFDLLASVR